MKPVLRTLLLVLAAETAVGVAGEIARQSSTAPQLLVLANGRVVGGTIRSDTFGYHVETAQSNLFFPYENVKFPAADLHDAYHKMADSIADRSVRRDLILARWCFENQLFAEAAVHLRAVVKVDATNEEAKKLLAMLEQPAVAKNADGRAGRPATAAEPGRLSESLGRLSPRTARDYVTSIQPMLLSRCGAVHCHGSSAPTSFRLELVRLGPGSNRAVTSRNLESVLERVDLRSPSKSQLLDKGLNPHGDRIRAPFEGRTGADQERRLRAWVQTVAAELNDRNHEDAARASLDARTRRRQLPRLKDPKVTPASVEGSGPVRMPEANGPTVRRAADAALSDRAPHEPSPAAAREPSANLGPLTDPFDPAEFNAGLK